MRAQPTTTASTSTTAALPMTVIAAAIPATAIAGSDTSTDNNSNNSNDTPTPSTTVNNPIDNDIDTRSSFAVRKELDMRLTAYLPAVVRRHLETQDCRSNAPLLVPATHETTVVSMFADVSGFTAMTESLAARGPVGAEFLAKHLNSYFEQLLRHVASAGGDVFKFAGDAMLIFWSENKDDTLASLVRRAIQCALRIQSHLHKAELAPGVVLSVKMGIGVGGATIAHLGGTSDGAIQRVEYIAVGPALQQAFGAEHVAEPGDVIVSAESWALAAPFFTASSIRESSCMNVSAVVAPIRMCSRRPSFTRDDALLHRRMQQYVSRAVWPYLDAHDEFWGSELRDVTVLFINLGFCEDDLAKMLDIRGLEKLQQAFARVQQSVYAYEGTINKFLVDDKGSTVIAAFGLPPVTHENDPVRGILASLAICAALTPLALKASVGITTGTALCGVVGHQGNRREYTVLGDMVNLSARLMQRAKSEHGGVITDERTKLLSESVLHFEERPEIMVKGKNDSIKIHRPYPRMSTLSAFHLSTIRGAGTTNERQGPTQLPNLMDAMHRVQVRDAQRRLSMQADDEAIATADRIVQSDNWRRTHDALLRKCSALNPFAPGGCVVLEGDIGVGKTLLLRAALTSPEARAYHILQGTATPFATRKPYAIWADMITKCALAQRSSVKAIDKTTQTTPQSDVELLKEADRRRDVALFVRQMIKDGAAPNTTLVSYAKLLNDVLDTDFEAFAPPPLLLNDDDDDLKNERLTQATGMTMQAPAKRLTLLGSDVWDVAATANNQQNHDNGVVQAPQAPQLQPPQPLPPQQPLPQRSQQRRGSAIAIPLPLDDANSLQDRQGHEDELAAWFLGLLELDLERGRRSSDDLRILTPIDDRTSAASSTASSSSTTTTTSGGVRIDDSLLDLETEPEWTPTDLDLRGILLLCALHALSRKQSTVFCLDAAMYMDEQSWILATIVCKYFTNCVVVIGTRPPSRALSDNTQSSSCCKRLRVLKRMRSTVCLLLEPLCSADVEQLARELLEIDDVPRELLAILVSRSQGNPLILRELIAEMLQQQVIQVDRKHRTCRLQVQEPWGDKSHASICFSCHSKLGASKDKHRCKCCGYIFCAPCTPAACQRKIPGVCNEPVRHCQLCYQLASTRRPTSERSLSVAATAGGSSSSSSTAAGSSASTSGRHRHRMRSMFTSSSSSSSSSAAAAAAAAHAASVAKKPLAPLKDRIALRPPRTVKSVLTTLLDQLTVSQRMLLKTASVIGAVFDDALLRGASPIRAHLARFTHDIQELERLAMIRRIDPFVGKAPASAVNGGSAVSQTQTQTQPKLKVKYEFGHGFMQDVLRSQMLCSQLDKLSARVTECRDQQERLLRQKFFEKANARLAETAIAAAAHAPVATSSTVSRMPLLAIAAPQLLSRHLGLERRRGSTPINGQAGGSATGAAASGASSNARRALTPTDKRSATRFFHRTHSSADPSSQLSAAAASAATIASRTGASPVPSSAESSSSQSPEYSPDVSTQSSQSSSTQLTLDATTAAQLTLVVPRALGSASVVPLAPACVLLKAGCVYVKKRSSVFSHLKLKSLTSARQWKKRFAVLHSTRLVLQYDEQSNSNSVPNVDSGLHVVTSAEARQGTSLYLKGAKVSACDPEVATKVNCLQIDVNEWTKGRHVMTERRAFVLDAQSEKEVGDWVYMIRYAIESLDNQQQQ